MNLNGHYSEVGMLLQKMDAALAHHLPPAQYLEVTHCVSDFQTSIGLLLLNMSFVNRMATCESANEQNPHIHSYLAELNMMLTEIGRTLTEIEYRRQGYLERS